MSYRDIQNGRYVDVLSYASHHEFTDVAGPIETQVWAGINDNSDVVRIDELVKSKTHLTG